MGQCLSHDWKGALAFSGSERPLVDRGSRWMAQLGMAIREGQFCLLIPHTCWRGIFKEGLLLYLKSEAGNWMVGHVFHVGHTSHCPTWNTDFSLEFRLRISCYEKLAEVMELWWSLRGKKRKKAVLTSSEHFILSLKLHLEVCSHSPAGNSRIQCSIHSLSLRVYTEYSLKHTDSIRTL